MPGKINIPRIKKTISDFVCDERGQITKASALKIGTLAGTIAACKIFSDLITMVEGGSHSSYYTHGNTVTMTSDYIGDECSIEISRTHYNHSDHTNS